MKYKNSPLMVAAALAVLALSISTCGTPKKATTEAVATPAVEVPSTPNPDPSLPYVYFIRTSVRKGL